MELTIEQIKKIAPTATTKNISIYLPFINSCIKRYEFTDLMVCAYLSQILVESGALYYVKEIASGKAYEGRKDLGNTEVGDGRHYKGRGILQITGRANYKKVGDLLGIDLINSPEMLETPKWAVETSFLYFKMNKFYDILKSDNIKKITKCVNGGYNHLVERTAYYEKAKSILL